MEAIEFRYTFNDEDEIRIIKRNEDGLHDYEVCEAFQDFMKSIGFSEENVFRFFRE